MTWFANSSRVRGSQAAIEADCAVSRTCELFAKRFANQFLYLFVYYSWEQMDILDNFLSTTYSCRQMSFILLHISTEIPYFVLFSATHANQEGSRTVREQFANEFAYSDRISRTSSCSLKVRELQFVRSSPGNFS